MSAVRKQPRLSFDELLHLRWLLGGALAALSIGTMFYLEPEVWPVAIGAILTIVVCAAYPQWPGRVPLLLWRLIVPGVAAVFVFDWMVNGMIPAFVRLNALLVLLRAISYRTRREDLQLLALCLFLVVLTGVLTVSIVFAIHILAFTGLAMGYMFVVNLLRDLETGSGPSTIRWVLIPRRRLFARMSRVVDLRMMLLAAVLSAAVLGLATVIFIAIPRLRLDNALSFVQLNRAGSLTGFSETIALGDVTDIMQDNSIAMRVDVGDPTVLPAVPYWRMVVLDDYDHGTFQVSRAVTANVGAWEDHQTELVPEWITTQRRFRPNAQRYDFFLEAGVSRYLPLPGMFSRLRFKETQQIVANRFFLTYSTQRPSAKLVSYRVEGVDPRGLIFDPALDREPLRPPRMALHALDYPATTKALNLRAEERAYLADVVAEISGGESLDARAFAQRVCEWLAARHRYSLTVSLPARGGLSGMEDPVIRWLQGGSPGHCEFFAAAFTLINRAAGFSTRAITGFKGGTWNAFENYYMVRNSDAHAWCEVHEGGGSWFRVDPTPGAGGVDSPGLESALALMAGDRSASAYLDSLRMIWYRRIVSFDQSSQIEVLTGLRSFSDGVAWWARATAETLSAELISWINRPWTFRNRGDLLFVALVCLLAATVMRRLGIGTSDLLEWFRTGEKPTRRRAGQLLRRLEMRIAEPGDQPWDVASAREIAAQLRFIRYGRAESWPDTLPVFRSARRLL